MHFLIASLAGAGFKALFVNVDLPVLGKRVNEMRNKFRPTDVELPTLIEEGESNIYGSYGTGYGGLFSLVSASWGFVTDMDCEIQRLHGETQSRGCAKPPAYRSISKEVRRTSGPKN